MADEPFGKGPFGKKPFGARWPGGPDTGDFDEAPIGGIGAAIGGPGVIGAPYDSQDTGASPVLYAVDLTRSTLMAPILLRGLGR